jgi:subtilisin family serine protease
MGTSGLRVAIVAALALLAAPAAAAAAPETVSGPWTSQWFVELESAPAADGTSASTLTAERSRFKAQARAAGISYRQRFSYSTLFNGVSISTSDGAIAEIRNLDGVAAVYPVQTATLDQTPSAFEPELAFAITMTGASIAQSRLGFTGRGVHVAVMDSGIDYDHPDLGGCFGPRCRVSNGYDFVGDDYDEEVSDPTWQPVPHPDPNPDDCLGHGTHVAGIIGARGAITGVAPDVTFGSYRVFGCNGATSADVMLAAMERIYRDGADVLNMSIAEDLSSWPEAPTAKAASRLVAKGIVVVAGAGNNRPDGLWGGGAPGVGAEVISAASVDNLKVRVPAIALSPDGRGVVYLDGNGSVPLPRDGTFDIARTGGVTTPDDACKPLAPGSLAGKVALIRRGTCTFIVKGMNAADAGAVGVIFYNDVGDIDGRPTVTGVPIPVIYIALKDGELINQRLDDGPVSMTWGATSDVPNPTAGLLSSFSAWGLAADLSSKPDIAAPGGLIRSTWPVEKGSYTVLSGTSMASPHVAGAAALYLQAHPRTRARDVRSILQNSADPLPWAGAPGLGFLDHVARQGAGMLDIDDAILATTEITPGKLSLGDSATATASLTIANDGAKTTTYALSNADALAIAGRDFVTEHPELGPSAVAFTVNGRPATSVTVRPYSTARVGVTITPSAGLSEGAIYGGYLVFMPDVGDQPLRVPYSGYKGDYQAVPATTPTSKGFPWLARTTGVAFDGHILPVYAKQEAGAVFTLAPKTLTTDPPSAITRPGADIPFVLVHMNNQARRIRIEVFSTRHRRRVSFGEVLTQDFVARNKVENILTPPSALATALPLDGTTRLGHRRYRLPDGEYYVVMTVERALAERGTPTETWTSPTFRIDRARR